MPQLIAMIIVIVAAMIYMFQTFGGTGDKITAVAQKSVIITEINNVKNAVHLANEGKILERQAGTSATYAHTIEGLARLGYFDKLINDQVINSVDARAVGTETADNLNVYKALSFGGDRTATVGDLEISLVASVAAATTDKPGIFVSVGGTLANQAGFIESQVAVDLASIAYIDRNASNSLATTTFDSNGTFVGTAGTHTGTDTDGMFTIYFKDIKAGNVQ